MLLSLLAVLVGCGSDKCLTAEGDAVYYGETLIGSFRSVAADVVEYSDNIEQLDANTLKITRTFTALNDVDSVRLTLDFCHAHRSVSAMIPSVTYNGNHWGRGKEPKGFRTDGVWHTYSYRRTPIPGATYSESNDFAVAMWSIAPADEADAFSCSLQPDTADVVHSLILPEEERPFMYIDKNRYADGAARMRGAARVRPDVTTLLAAGSGAALGTVHSLNLYLSGVLPAILFFPIANGGLILMTAAVSMVIFREKLNVKQWVGLIMGVVIICLM